MNPQVAKESVIMIINKIPELINNPMTNPQTVIKAVTKTINTDLRICLPDLIRYLSKNIKKYVSSAAPRALINRVISLM